MVIEVAGEGHDTVRAFITHTLAANVEDLVLLGAAAIDGTGNGIANLIVGNEAANSLSGGSGDDSLDGGGAADTLAGGLHNDSYTVDDEGDVIEELAGEGTDHVHSSVTYTLSANVERLSLVGPAAIEGTGNNLANRITGNSSANALSGLDGNDQLEGGLGEDTLDGGLGLDVMSGGIGSDVYVVDRSDDNVFEEIDQGRDEVRSTAASLILSGNIENLTLLGSGDIDGGGNDQANRINGNNGDNVLSGGGGDDTIFGNAGDDELFGQQGIDLLLGGAGADTWRC